MTATRAGSAPAAVRRTHGLSATADGRVVPSTARRFADRLRGEDPALGWLVTVVITSVAGFLRFWHLGSPSNLMFDETYYAKDGWSLWQHGYAQEWVPQADQAIVAGRYSPDLMTGDPSMVVHPELGKWLIGAGEQLFGIDAFGWRFASAVVGTAMVWVMIRLVRRLAGSTLLGAVAGLLLCVDGLQFVLSRMALLDIFVGFFLLSAVSCLVADRDWGRAAMARLAPRSSSAWGPVRGLRWRPWRLAAGLMFGLAISCKWSALVPLAGLGLLAVCWDAGARRAVGVRLSFLRAAVVDGVPALLYLVGMAFLVYVVSWTGWLVHAHAYELALSRNQYGPFWGSYTRTEAHGFGAVTQGLRSLWHYHTDLWRFHSSGLDEATHAYGSDPRGWLILNRPVGAYVLDDIAPGTAGCRAPADSTCLRRVLLLGTPALWWGGTLALLYAVYGWALRRDWRCGLVIVGALTTWVPFFRYAGRPIFSFYVITTLPFMIIALCLVLGRLIGSDLVPSRSRTLRVAAGGAFVVLVVLNFAWFWPIYTHELLTVPQWLERIWFETWI